MSFRGTREHLEDILRSIHLIEEFTRGTTLEEYADDLKLRAAVERHVEIIAEAAYRLGEETSRVDPVTAGEHSKLSETCSAMRTIALTRR